MSQALGLPRDYAYWTGWEARLIISKQSMPKQKISPNNYDVEIPDDLKTKKIKSDSQVMDLEDKNMNVTARKQHVVVGVPAHHADKAKECSLVSADERVLKIAEVVVAAAGKIVSSVRWRILPSVIADRYEEQVWRSIIKLVLSIIDVDDILIEGRDKRVCQCRSLFNKLNAFFDVTDGSKYMSDRDYVMLSNKWQSQVMKCIADGDKCLGLEDFVGLSDGDVARLIMYDIAPAATESNVFAWTPWGLPSSEKWSVPEGFLGIVLEEMKTFVPLKEDRRMQLALELSRGQPGFDHVLEYLFVEACKGFMSEELFKDVDEHLKRNGKDCTSEYVLSRRAEKLFTGLWNLCCYKREMSRYSERGALHPLSCGAFGEFSEEVFQVAKIANCERKARGRCFVDIHDIIAGLSLSSIRGHKIVQGMAATSRPAQEIPQMPLYKVYKVAGELANKLGDKIVELGHLALAVNWFINTDDALSLSDGEICATLEGLRKCGAKQRKCDDDESTGETVKEKCMLHGLNPFYGYEELVRAIRGGLTAPDIRAWHQKSYFSSAFGA